MPNNDDRIRMIPALLAALVVAVVVAGVVIAVGDGDNPSSTAVSSESTTRATTVDGDTSTSPGAITPVVPSTPITIPSKRDGVSPDGSGCAPPAGASLPDGLWFGDLEAVDATAGTISLDLNCFFTGDAATRAYQQDHGGPGDAVPNDYYIRNKVARVYTLSAVPNVAVVELDGQGGGPLDDARSGLRAAASSLDAFDHRWIGWVQVRGGQVVAIQQQFVP